MKQHLPFLTTFTLYLAALSVGTAIPSVLLINHDFSIWRLGLAVVAVLVAGAVLTFIHLAVVEAKGE